MFKILESMFQAWVEAFKTFAQAFTPNSEFRDYYGNKWDFNESVEDGFRRDAEALRSDWNRIGSYFPIKNYYNYGREEEKPVQKLESRKRRAKKTLEKYSFGKRKRLGLSDNT